MSYRGNVEPIRIMVPMELPPGFKYPDTPVHNYVDREVFARLKLLNMAPSELCTDEEFLRRVTIDTIGQLPSPEEVRAFLADKSKDKRAKKIDELLKQADELRNKAIELGKKKATTGGDQPAKK